MSDKNKSIPLFFNHALNFNKVISKSNKKIIIRLQIALLILCLIHSAEAQTVIYSTDFGTTANVNPAGWTFTGIDLTISTNSTSSGYTGFSGGAYLGEGNSIAFINTSGTSYASSQLGTSTATVVVNTVGYTSISVGFGMRKSSAGYNSNATYMLEWSNDNITFNPISFTESTAGTWGLASGAGLTLPIAAENQPSLYLRWTFNRTGTASNFKIDDFKVKGLPPGAMRITEFMYNGLSAGSLGEFVEFTNIGSTPVDMNGWSFDDNSRIAGSQSLSLFNIVQPGESVILTDLPSSTFHSNWALCSAVKVIGDNTNNLEREDEINLYDGSGTLIDRLTYGDQTFAPGTIRTNSTSGWVNASGLGTNTISNWTLSAAADAEASYLSSLSEIGSPGKSTRAGSPFNPCLIVAGAPTIVMDVATTTNYLDGSVTTSPASPYVISGVINDPTDPASTLGINFLLGDDITPVSSLIVTAVSSNISVVPNANVIVTGIDSARNVKITPISVGYSTITVTVNDGGLSTSYQISYAASIASTTPANTFWHTGISDASDAIAFDNNYYVTGDDEINVLNVYSRAASGLPFVSFDFTSYLSLPDLVKPEVDIEAAAKSTAFSNRIYWLGSMSNGKAPFNNKPNRDRIFATTNSGTGPSTTFSFVGYYGNLRSQLIAWGDANGYNFTASAAAGVDSKTISGFAAEGMVFGPDNTTLYIGMRAPLVPTANRTKAVIAPIINFETWFNNGAPSGVPTFATPIELDLGGRGLRDLTRISDGTYIIVAGNFGGSPITSAIYKWTGNPIDAPIPVTTPADGILNLEGIMQINSGGLLTSASLQVVTDGGDEILYADGNAAKDFNNLNLRKFRSDNLNSLNLCIGRTGDTTAVACNNFLWHGINYASSGTPTHLYTTAFGCDSVVTLHLTINPLPSIPTISQSLLTLTSTAASSYQWYLNGVPMSGENSQSVTIIGNGNYTVEITNSSGCSIISSPYNVSTTDVSLVSAINTISIFPNPFAESATISIHLTKTSTILVEVYNLLGEKVETLANSEFPEGVNDFSFKAKQNENRSGMYFVKVSINNEVSTIKIVEHN